MLSKGFYNCNSRHRDPGPQLHIPIVTNPGSLLVVNHHVTHLTADGSVYFTDTRGYHTALNSGEIARPYLCCAGIPARHELTIWRSENTLTFRVTRFNGFFKPACPHFRYRSDKQIGVRVMWRHKQVVGRRLFGNLSVIHNNDMVCE